VGRKDGRSATDGVGGGDRGPRTNPAGRFDLVAVTYNLTWSTGPQSQCWKDSPDSHTLPLQIRHGAFRSLGLRFGRPLRRDGPAIFTSAGDIIAEEEAEDAEEARLPLGIASRSG
jgi:hypothetical protein